MVTKKSTSDSLLYFENILKFLDEKFKEDHLQFELCNTIPINTRITYCVKISDIPFSLTIDSRREELELVYPLSYTRADKRKMYEIRKALCNWFATTYYQTKPFMVCYFFNGKRHFLFCTGKDCYDNYLALYGDQHAMYLKPIK